MSRHAVFYALGRAIPGVIGLIALSLYTRLLDPQEFGNYTVVLASVGVCNAIAFYWLRVAAVRQLPIEPMKRPLFLGSLYATYFAITFACIVVAASVALLVRDGTLRGLIVVGITLLVSQSWFELRLDLTLASLESSRYLRLALARSAIAATVGALLAYLGYGARGVITGSIAGYLAPTIAVRGSLRMQWVARPPTPVIRRILGFGLPLAGVFSLGVLTNWSDRFLLAWLLGTAAAGQYGAVSDLSTQTITALMMITTLSALPLAVRAYETAGPSAAERELWQQGAVLVGIALPAVVGLALLAPEISALMFGKGFQEAGRALIPIVAVAGLFAGMKSFYFDLAFQLSGTTRRQFSVTAVMAVVSIALNVLLIPRVGLRGAAYSMLSTFGLGCLLSAIIGRRAFVVPLPVREWAKAAVGTAVMAAWLLLSGVAIAAPLVWKVLSAVLIYSLVLLMVDAGGSREALRAFIRSRKPRPSGP